MQLTVMQFFSLTCSFEVSFLKTDQCDFYDQVKYRVLSVFDLILYIGSRIQISVFSIRRVLTDLVFSTHVDFGFQFCHFIFGLRI